MKNPNIKIEDKLLCKIDYSYIGQKFYKGEEYEVYDIKKTENEFFNYYSYSIIDKIKCKMLYLIDNHLNDIFYSIKEVRIMKLEKINEESES